MRRFFKWLWSKFRKKKDKPIPEWKPPVAVPVEPVVETVSEPPAPVV